MIGPIGGVQRKWMGYIITTIIRLLSPLFTFHKEWMMN